MALQNTNTAPVIELMMGTKMEFGILVVNNGDEPAYDAILSVTSEQKLPPLADINCEGGNERCAGDSCEVCRIGSPSNRFKNALIYMSIFKMILHRRWQPPSNVNYP